MGSVAANGMTIDSTIFYSIFLVLFFFFAKLTRFKSSTVKHLQELFRHKRCVPRDKVLPSHENTHKIIFERVSMSAYGDDTQTHIFAPTLTLSPLAGDEGKSLDFACDASHWLRRDVGSGNHSWRIFYTFMYLNIKFQWTTQASPEWATHDAASKQTKKEKSKI